ncbi:unnamed protein product [Adineta ricciae]|nr:unnamed protein product [Adineta ricciae]
MASLDRMFVSSSNVHMRHRSNKRFVLFIIVFLIIFWSLFHLHAFFTSEIQINYGNRLTCTTRSGISTSFVSYYGLINAIIPIISMSLFGIETLRNISKAHAQIGQRSLDKRLIILLIIQISLYIFLRLPMSTYLIYSQTTKYMIKSSNQTLIEQFVYFIVIFCQFVQVNLSPLMNLISKSFRLELKRTFYRVIHQEHQIHRSLVQTRNGNTIQIQEMMTRQNNTLDKHQLVVRNA